MISLRTLVTMFTRLVASAKAERDQFHTSEVAQEVAAYAYCLGYVETLLKSPPVNLIDEKYSLPDIKALFAPVTFKAESELESNHQREIYSALLALLNQWAEEIAPGEPVLGYGRPPFKYHWSHEYPYQISTPSEDHSGPWCQDTVRSLEDYEGIDMERVLIYRYGRLFISGEKGHTLCYDYDSASGLYTQRRTDI